MPAFLQSEIDPAHNCLEFLQDGHGKYGLDFRDQLESWVGTSSGALVIRPDKLSRENTHLVTNVALQPIPCSPYLFKHSTERYLARNLGMILFEESAKRGGINPWVGPGKIDLDDERARRKFFGCRAKAHRITNFLVRQLLAEAGDESAIRVARRFRPKWRGSIYYLATRSARLSQVCETFPYLAWVLSAATIRSRPHELPIQPVTEAIEAGWPLRHVAELAGIPFAMRVVPPLAATLVGDLCDLFRRNPHLIERMPRGAHAASAWLRMLNQAYDISHDFADWCAKRIEVRPPYEQLVIDTSNIGDWIKASYEKHVQAEIECLTERLKGEVPAQYIKRRLESPFGSGDTRSLVTRTFKSSMSLRTVRRLSEDWHDAVADQRFSGDTRPFPKAWATATEIGEFKIVPLESALDLHHEGKAMHNCVTTYSGHVHGGACYLFSMQKDERRIATIEIGIGSDGFRLAQFSGPCNQRIDKKLERIIRKWVRATKFEREEVRNKLPAGMEWCPANGANLDLEIPF